MQLYDHDLSSAFNDKKKKTNHKRYLPQVNLQVEYDCTVYKVLILTAAKEPVEQNAEARLSPCDPISTCDFYGVVQLERHSSWW